MPTPSEPTIPVPMTRTQRDAIDWAAPEVRLSEVARELEAVVDAYDAAAARPAEPVCRIYRCQHCDATLWTDTPMPHYHASGECCGPVRAYDVIATREVGGEVPRG
jgi:hypothetical protein